jgi:hypothetical protein
MMVACEIGVVRNYSWIALFEYITDLEVGRMERPGYGIQHEVSARWTPQHLDVTDAPLRYAAPKAAWIDGFDKLRIVADAGDRMARLRMHTRAVVDPAEITVLPPLPRPVVADRPRRVRSLLKGLRAALG